ncbi:hypothetical protein [Ideonella sp. BN130291]|uniref:hypothetical protein n=1 Tax=Ideonella sp. BN130291 TaxID=3112940 RepID=UPI002E264B3E
MRSPISTTRRVACACALAAAALQACVVVPVDPRTGQPYPATPRDPMGQAPVTVIAPPAAPSGQPPQASLMTARLYPLNTQANQGGLLTATVIDNHTGRGSFSLVYLGDTLQGEATRVDGSYSAFGRLHNEVLGVAPRGFSGRRGIANAYGSRGVNAQCEYVLSGPAQGTGVCLFSDGAKYQMHFGA